jgi:hypothetical protein
MLTFWLVEEVVGTEDDLLDGIQTHEDLLGCAWGTIYTDQAAAKAAVHHKLVEEGAAELQAYLEEKEYPLTWAHHHDGTERLDLSHVYGIGTLFQVRPVTVA